MSPRQRIVFGGGLLVWAACADPTDTTQSEIGPANVLRSASKPGSQFRPLTYDDEMVATVDELPGFAGMYVNAAGEMVVRLRNPSLLSQAAPIVDRLLARVSYPGAIVR